MQVRMITAEETLPLRNRVLRPAQPREACRYPLDVSAVHLGAFVDRELVSIVSAHPEDHPLFQVTGQWRIRGMASAPERQGQGLGSAVLKGLLDWGRAQSSIPLFWCNARERAIPFYLRHGFQAESELFDIAGIGPHRVMMRRYSLEKQIGSQSN